MNKLVTNCDRFNCLKHSTVRSYAFTEQGVAMLSQVHHFATNTNSTYTPQMEEIANRFGLKLDQS